MSQMIQLDTVTQLLIEKGIRDKELVAKSKPVQSQYEARRAEKE